MRYRYITSGRCQPSEPICSFRLISHVVLSRVQKYVGAVIYRVHMPDDLTLEKFVCDEYATTNDTRTLEELGYDIMMVMWDGKKRVIPRNADLNELSMEQYKKWTQSLYSDPDNAYHMYRPGDSYDTVQKKGDI